MLSFRDSGKKENMPYISWASASTGRQKIKEKGGDFLGVFVFMDQICNGIYITSAHIPLAKIQSHGLNGKKKKCWEIVVQLFVQEGRKEREIS